MPRKRTQITPFLGVLTLDKCGVYLHYAGLLFLFLITDSCAWMERLAKGLGYEEFDLFLIICWAIWWNRNRTLMEHITLMPDELIKFALHYLQTYRQVHASPENITFASAPARWSPPDTNWVKINFDGAIFQSTMELGIGVVARDASGNCVGWISARKNDWQNLNLPKLLLLARRSPLLVLFIGRKSSLRGTALTYIQIIFSKSGLLGCGHHPSGCEISFH
ncbi:hypothetical protein Sango_0221600 [Sesamum angolense]|uniref:RNase H type-1 domain-containing protein n=1 Tax=Sesamum angolense TaxID=2727404 RepID=A0AAE2C747_9LAMI|nr:hypothetical protein Sango_0221600 [Sesamum angolense]